MGPLRFGNAQKTRFPGGPPGPPSPHPMRPDEQPSHRVSTSAASKDASSAGFARAILS